MASIYAVCILLSGALLLVTPPRDRLPRPIPLDPTRPVSIEHRGFGDVVGSTSQFVLRNASVRPISLCGRDRGLICYDVQYLEGGEWVRGQAACACAVGVRYLTLASAQEVPFVVFGGFDRRPFRVGVWLRGMNESDRVWSTRVDPPALRGVLEGTKESDPQVVFLGRFPNSSESSWWSLENSTSRPISVDVDRKGQPRCHIFWAGDSSVRSVLAARQRDGVKRRPTPNAEGERVTLPAQSRFYFRVQRGDNRGPNLISVTVHEADGWSRTLYSEPIDLRSPPRTQ